MMRTLTSPENGSTSMSPSKMLSGAAGRSEKKIEKDPQAKHRFWLPAITSKWAGVTVEYCRLTA